MKCVRIHTDTYELLRVLSKEDKRTILSTIDIIVEGYMEERNEEKKLRGKKQSKLR